MLAVVPAVVPAVVRRMLWLLLVDVPALVGDRMVEETS
jgi:hypothetical protein